MRFTAVKTTLTLKFGIIVYFQGQIQWNLACNQQPTSFRFVLTSRFITLNLLLRLDDGWCMEVDLGGLDPKNP